MVGSTTYDAVVVATDPASAADLMARPALSSTRMREEPSSKLSGKPAGDRGVLMLTHWRECG